VIARPATAAGTRTRLFETEATRGSRLHRGIDGIALRWFARRGRVSGDHRLDRRSIYILPTRAGLVFGCAMATMLLAAINYSLQLGYLLTFLLFALALVSMLHTYRNLAGLVLRPGRADPVHAGSIAEFNITILNRSRLARYAVQIDVAQAAQPTLHDAAAEAEAIARLAVATRGRGIMAIPRLRLSTTFPLGLWRAWSYWHPAVHIVVWPTPEVPAVTMPPGAAKDGKSTASGAGEDDFSAVRPYREGDSLRRLAWKAMARSDGEDPLTKAFDGGLGGEQRFDFRALPATLDTEARLQRLCRWILVADQEGLRFTLALPEATIGPDSGPAHRARCLEALALHGAVAPQASLPPRR
jgi:uncharacterized protein (DUF58 family)